LSSNRVRKRLRVFAGPNGSGKSTIINSIRNTKIAGWPIDFGVYINADDIARLLRSNKFSFKAYKLNQVSREEFVQTALSSGLVGNSFSETAFRASFSISDKHKVILRKSKQYDEEIAQIIADFLRRKLVELEEKVSFETVFSHPSKIHFMEEAKTKGYKVYLYFISTESPEINLSRIKDVRVPSGGHDVPADKVVARYSRSMELLYEATQLTYQTYFFDNSHSPPSNHYFAHFKMSKGSRKWDIPDEDSLPSWFYTYFVNKQNYNN